jgi:hypothetical protein
VYRTISPNSVFRFLDMTKKVKLKKRAIRSGVWFKALRRIDGVLMDLTMKVAGNIRSITLAKCILAIARKLGINMESRLLRAFREVGMPFAQKLSLVAQKWGNISAKMWVFASSFVKFLAVMHINAPKTFKSSPTILFSKIHYG